MSQVNDSPPRCDCCGKPVLRAKYRGREILLDPQPVFARDAVRELLRRWERHDLPDDLQSALAVGLHTAWVIRALLSLNPNDLWIPAVVRRGPWMKDLVGFLEELTDRARGTLDSLGHELLFARNHNDPFQAAPSAMEGVFHLAVQIERQLLLLVQEVDSHEKDHETYLQSIETNWRFLSQRISKKFTFGEADFARSSLAMTQEVQRLAERRKALTIEGGCGPESQLAATANGKPSGHADTTSDTPRTNSRKLRGLGAIAGACCEHVRKMMREDDTAKRSACIRDYLEHFNGSERPSYKSLYRTLTDYPDLWKPTVTSDKTRTRT